jgi:hypothetical protein
MQLWASIHDVVRSNLPLIYLKWLKCFGSNLAYGQTIQPNASSNPTSVAVGNDFDLKVVNHIEILHMQLMELILLY